MKTVVTIKNAIVEVLLQRIPKITNTNATKIKARKNGKLLRNYIKTALTKLFILKNPNQIKTPEDLREKRLPAKGDYNSQTGNKPPCDTLSQSNLKIIIIKTPKLPLREISLDLF